MEIDKKLYEEIKEYCKLNGLKPSEYVNALLKKAFMEDKYGAAPFKKEVTFVGNKKFDEAVIAEINEIIHDREKLSEFIKTHQETFVNDKPDANGRVYTKETMKDAVEKFNESLNPDKNQVSQLDEENVDLDKNSSTNSSNVSQSEKKTVKKHTIKPIK